MSQRSCAGLQLFGDACEYNSSSGMIMTGRLDVCESDCLE